MPQWQELSTVEWVGVGIAAYHVVFTILWIIFKTVWGRRVAPWWFFIGYSGFLLIFWSFSEIYRNPRW